MPTRLRSFCKINLGLAVGPPRPDGFHGLTTLYQTLALHDIVTVDARPAAKTRITLEADHPGVPCTASGNCEKNTAYRMVAGALERLGVAAEVHITIEKRLPVQGGLGAGSANAAAALLALERELGQALPGPDRLSLAAAVGSDVPLFLIGGAVLGLNRGEQVSPFPDSPALPIVVAVPEVGVSTAQAFRDLDARMSSQSGVQIKHEIDPGLTGAPELGRLEKLSRVLTSAWTPSGACSGFGRATTGIAGSSSLQPAGAEELPSGSAGASPLNLDGDLAGNPLLALVRTGVENDFEDVAFRQHPSLREIKRVLDDSGNGIPGAVYAALSGSGSALFGLYSSSEAAREAQQRVQSLGTRALLTETLTRREYWRRMFA